MRTLFAAAALAAATAIAAPAFVLAQGAPQTVQLTKLDVVKVATGCRFAAPGSACRKRATAFEKDCEAARLVAAYGPA